MRALLLITLSLCVALPALAQIYPLSSDEITEEKAQELFSDLKKENMKMSKFSECFQRAHLWAYRAEKLHGITMEKAFLLFTYKFSMKHTVLNKWGNPMTWWYHVAPAVRVNGELWVMDATFTDRAMPLQQWASSLMKEPEVCQPVDTDRENYVSDRNATAGYKNLAMAKHQCYYAITPRLIFGPQELGLVDDKVKNGGMKRRALSPVPADWYPRTLKATINNAYLPAYRSAARRELDL